MTVNEVIRKLVEKGEFEEEQLSEIRKGLESGADVSVYAKPEFSWEQMREIRLGLDYEKKSEKEVSDKVVKAMSLF